MASKQTVSARRGLPMLANTMPPASPLMTMVAVPELFVPAVHEAHSVFCLQAGENIPLHEFLGLLIVAGLEDF